MAEGPAGSEKVIDMCECDYVRPDVYERTRPVARKLHRCDECAGQILPGEVYRRDFGVWDGEARTYKTCLDCDQFHGWAVEQNGDDICYGFGNMIHDVGDCLDEMGDRTVMAEMRMRWSEVRRKRRAIGISA